MASDPPEPTRASPGASWLRLQVERATLPNGNTVDLSVVRHPGASAIVPFLPDGRILLIRQYRYVAEGEIWEIPAGKLDPGEAPEQCAARELEEETGYRPGRLESLGPMWASPGFTDEVIHLFAAFDLEATRQALEADEVIELHPTAPERVLEMVFASEISDSKSALAILLAARRQGWLG